MVNKGAPKRNISLNGVTKKGNDDNDIRINSIINSDNYKKQILKIYHQNICGLEFEFEELLPSLYLDLPDILCISEHHLNSMQIQLISLEEYSLGAEFCRQSFHNGEICVYVNKRYPFSVINIARYCKEKELEAYALKLQLQSINICIITVYRSLSGNFQFFLNGLENIINRVYKPGIHLIICGDININYLNESKEKQENK
jgi:exonuclease III